MIPERLQKMISEHLHISASFLPLLLEHRTTQRACDRPPRALELKGTCRHVPHTKHCRKELICELATVSVRMTRNYRCLVGCQAPAPKLPACIVTITQRTTPRPAFVVVRQIEIIFPFFFFSKSFNQSERKN